MAMRDGVQGGGDLQAAQAGGNIVQSLIQGSAARSAAKANAAMAMQGAEMQARQIRRAARAETGAARAAAAGAGVSLSSGSVMDAERDIARYSEQDALSVLVSGATEASQWRQRGRAAMTRAFTQAGDSLVHGLDAWQRTRRRAGFRADDPYRTPGYFGGAEGE